MVSCQCVGRRAVTSRWCLPSKQEVWRWIPANDLSPDTGTMLLLLVVEMSRGRAREVGAAGGRGGLCAGGEGCRELGRVLLFRTVDGGGVGRMHFLD